MARRFLKQVLLPFFEHVGVSEWLRADSLGFWREGEDRYWLPRVIFRRSEDGESPAMKIGLFAGIHGDEIAGIHGLIDLLRFFEEQDFLARAFQLNVYPVCNPSGYQADRRCSASGKDLNREFWRGSQEPEVILLEREIRRQRFDGIISYHADCDSHGLYAFAQGASLTKLLVEPALAAAAEALPTNLDSSIDGFHAVNGIISTAYEGILSAPPEVRPAPFEIILETPMHASLSLQQQSLVLATVEILRQYRRLMSYAANI